jgi:hypothetical protein
MMIDDPAGTTVTITLSLRAVVKSRRNDQAKRSVTIYLYGILFIYGILIHGFCA